MYNLMVTFSILTVSCHHTETTTAQDMCVTNDFVLDVVIYARLHTNSI